LGCYPVAVHVYTQTIHRTTQITTEQHKYKPNLEECGPCTVFASFTLAFALQMRKKHWKISVRVRKTSVRLRKTSVAVQKPQSPYKNLSQVKKNLSRRTKTLVRVEKPQSQYKNLSHSTVYIVPKTPTHYKALTNTHITKHTHTHTREYTHYKTI